MGVASPHRHNISAMALTSGGQQARNGDEYNSTYVHMGTRSHPPRLTPLTPIGGVLREAGQWGTVWIKERVAATVLGR